MPDLSRRALLSATALALPAAAATRAAASDTAGFTYEVVRTTDEWRDMLGVELCAIMREGRTEPQYSSDLVTETAPGLYCCKGCDLALYDGRWKRPVDKGWVFFAQSIPDAMLMSIDQAVPDGAVEATPEERMILDDSAAIEAHCRRCGSHIGHILIVDGALLHCSNGTALDFRPTEI